MPDTDPFEEGKLAAETGEECPYPEGTEERELWLETRDHFASVDEDGDLLEE